MEETWWDCSVPMGEMHRSEIIFRSLACEVAKAVCGNASTSRSQMKVKREGNMKKPSVGRRKGRRKMDVTLSGSAPRPLGATSCAIKLVFYSNQGVHSS